jgi:endonuclease/exonuclease/phosphatase family metal-dependent hydrolase
LKKIIGLMSLALPLFAQAEELRLLSWNIFMIPKPINFSLQGQRAPLMAKALKSSSYDIILLQEGFRKRTRGLLNRELRKNFPFQEYLQRSVRPNHFLNSGLLIYSRLPFKVLDHWYFTRCAHADCLSSKGALLIELTLPQGKRIQIVNTHLQAWDNQRAVGVRRQQFLEIKALLKKHAKNGVPQILAGDLNIDGNAQHEYPGILELMEMNSTRLESEIHYTSGLEDSCYKIPGGTPRQWLDHMWLNEQGAAAQIINKKVRPFFDILRGEECSLSDHYALEATVKL